MALLALPASAFDSGAWLAERAALDLEAARLAAVYTNCAASLVTPAENLVVPVENHPDGSVKVTVTARRAQFFVDAGYVWGEGVTLREYGAGGTNETARVEAGHCVVDRASKSVWAEGRVRVTYGGTTLEGEGIYFSFAREFVKIMSKVAIETSDVKFKGVKL